MWTYSTFVLLYSSNGVAKRKGVFCSTKEAIWAANKSLEIRGKVGVSTTVVFYLITNASVYSEAIQIIIILR